MYIPLLPPFVRHPFPFLDVLQQYFHSIPDLYLLGKLQYCPDTTLDALRLASSAPKNRTTSIPNVLFNDTTTSLTICLGAAFGWQGQQTEHIDVTVSLIHPYRRSSFCNKSHRTSAMANGRIRSKRLKLLLLLGNPSNPQLAEMAHQKVSRGYQFLIWHPPDDNDLVC